LASRFSSYPASVIPKYSPRSVSNPSLIYPTSARTCKNIFSSPLLSVHLLFFFFLPALFTYLGHYALRAQRSREVQYPGTFGRRNSSERSARTLQVSCHVSREGMEFLNRGHPFSFRPCAVAINKKQQRGAREPILPLFTRRRHRLRCSPLSKWRGAHGRARGAYTRHAP
jgi:hypothetical protein